MARLEGEVDALFKLPLSEFTTARNALAATLKKAGHEDEAAAVKALQKPSISAWAVNQVFWSHRAAFERLVEAGERFRTAQAAQLSGKSTDIRAPLDARREALADVSKLAADLLRAGGHPPSPDLMRRITTTLEALSTYAGIPDAPTAGRLTQDVDPPGFETLAALVPRIGGAKGTEPSRLLQFRQQPAPKPPKRKLTAEEAAKQEEEARRAARAAAKAAVQVAERTLRDARRDAERAEAALKKAAARAKETEREFSAAEKEKLAADTRFEKASADAQAARAEARRIATDAEEAAQAVEDAERALEKAKKDL